MWVGASIAAPYIGPLTGSFIVWRTTWRWVFWIFVMINGISLAITLLAAEESFYNKRIPRNQQPQPKSRLARLVGIEQRRSGVMNTAFQAVSRPVIAFTKLPVALITVYSILTFSWVIGERRPTKLV